MAKRTLNFKSTLIPTSIQGAPSRSGGSGHRLTYHVVANVREKMWDNQKHIMYNFYRSAEKFLKNDRYSAAHVMDGGRVHTRFKPYIDQTIVVRAEFRTLADLDDFYKELLKDANNE